MPTPKLYDNYPTEYTEIFRSAAKRPVRITLSTAHEADRFRARLYAFRNALLDEPQKAPEVALTISFAHLVIDGTDLIITHEDKRHGRPSLPESGRQFDPVDL